MILLVLLAGCPRSDREVWFDAQREAERARAAEASADDVCRVVRMCNEHQARQVPEGADINDRLALEGEQNLMAPACEAYQEEATKLGYSCRGAER